MREALMHELKHFLDADGRLTKMPVKRKKKLAFLVYLAPRFAVDRTYTEPEINEIIGAWHTFSDPATIRRELVEHGMLTRDPAGRKYRRKDTLPTLEELLRRYG